MVASLLGPFLGPFVTLAVCFLYPVYLTFQLLVSEKTTPSPSLRSDHLHYVVFWMLSAWILVLESIQPFSALVGLVPFYCEVKCVFFYWLASPQFKGAGWIWLNALLPAYQQVSPVCAELWRNHLPPQVQKFFETASASLVSGGGCDAAGAAFAQSREPSNATKSSKND